MSNYYQGGVFYPGISDWNNSPTKLYTSTVRVPAICDADLNLWVQKMCLNHDSDRLGRNRQERKNDIFTIASGYVTVGGGWNITLDGSDEPYKVPSVQAGGTYTRVSPNMWKNGNIEVLGNSAFYIGSVHITREFTYKSNWSFTLKNFPCVIGAQIWPTKTLIPTYSCQIFSVGQSNYVMYDGRISGGGSYNSTQMFWGGKIWTRQGLQWVCEGEKSLRIKSDFFIKMGCGGIRL